MPMPMPLSARTCRLLILDDDEMIGLTIQLIAEAAGASARLTTTPAAFFDALGSWQPTHICTDLNMPAMDGLQVLTELAQRHCRAHVIVSSGVGLRVLEAAARTGAEQGLRIAGVLPKPFSPVTLRQLLQGDPLTKTAPVPLKPAEPGYQPDRAALEQALERRELTVVYQPKVHCASGQLAGVEALVRWLHPVHGWIGPNRFIPLAEDAGCIDALTLQVLEQSLGWFVPWLAERPTERAALTLSINLSARSLGNPSLVTELHAQCQAAGLDASQLVFELTETAAMDNPVLALELLTRLRVQGFQLSIDDFGTGYSSMVQLVRLPFSEIKVDRSFVMTASQSSESRAIIRSIVLLGHSLGLRVTAEGVEDLKALTYLREVGCDLAQGYFLARPMAAAVLDTWAAGQRGGEAERLAALAALHLVDTAPQARFRRLASLAQQVLGARMAMINLIDATRQWPLATEETDNAKDVPALHAELPVELSLCTHAVHAIGVFAIANLAQDGRFSRNPLVAGPPFLRAYVGVPLRPTRGPAVGTLYAVDCIERVFSAHEQTLLQSLSAMVETELVADASHLTDPATGLLRQRAFDERAATLIGWAGQAAMTISLLLIEVGPPAADTADEDDDEDDDAAVGLALRALAQRLSGCAGAAALLARYGVRRLAAVLPGTSIAGIQTLIGALTRPEGDACLTPAAAAEYGQSGAAALVALSQVKPAGHRFGACTVSAGQTGDL